MLDIKKASAKDAEALCELYINHLTTNPPKEAQDMILWREKLNRFYYDDTYHILVGCIDEKIISSVTLIIVENLTHNLRPYALIENVVTHIGHRGRGYASELMDKASGIARDQGCYKIMLLTGSKKESTLKFYERCAFNCNDKTAFIKWI